MPVTGHGQTATTAKSKAASKHARAVAGACLGQWKKQSCLKVVSRSALVLAANYAGRLQKQGHSNSVRTIKNRCAAATAATKRQYKAEVMRSAYAECANAILEVSNATGLKPDQSHYQLLVGPVLCIKGDRRCSAIERGLRQYR
jgi:hypothetical protein